MTAFAEDISRTLKSSADSSETDIADMSIDIGLTKEPYYSDKSTAIKETTPPFYPSSPTHVHLVGYDTMIRFCNPKYYPEHDPPLSALKPFFEAGHKMCVTERPTDPNDSSSSEFGTVEEQKRYIEDLRNGEREKEGFEPHWGNNIDMMQAEEGVGISSTRVRRAAKRGDWTEVGMLCTEGVAAWIRDQSLYSEDASGKNTKN
jgi:nicotinamide-nucleotide adenylyltransferase